MARRAAAWRTTGAGSTTLPIASLFATAASDIFIVEIWAANSTAVAVPLALRRATAAGTAGAAQTVQYEEDSTQAALGNPVDTHTVAPTLTAGALRVITAGASIASGGMAAFGARGLRIPAGTANGLCIVPLTGTGQICDVNFVWDA